MTAKPNWKMVEDTEAVEVFETRSTDSPSEKEAADASLCRDKVHRANRARVNQRGRYR
jgi:hypothetical protein